MRLCPKLDYLIREADMGEMGRYIVYVIGRYNDCATRHDTLVEASR